MNDTRKVSVLIKDKHHRKKILEAQKKLKHTNMNDVRQYLRQHGIIKVGSTCPNDILRTTFNNALLTGDVSNTNDEVALQNYLATQPINH